jgi:hypothetical protein
MGYQKLLVMPMPVYGPVSASAYTASRIGFLENPGATSTLIFFHF